jgi:hypothetical protein
MKLKLQERGQSLVIIALAVVGLFGFSGLAIDGSRVFSDRRNAQNAADTAALAAALARIREPIVANKATAAELAATQRAGTNGYADDANSTVEVHMCNETGLTPPCEGLPGGATLAEYIQVKIESTIPATFARIVGRQEFTNIVTAIAHAEDAIPGPLFDGAALVTLKPDGSDTFTANGAAFLDVNNSGVFNNSRDLCGMSVVGSGEYHVDTSFQLAGAYNDHCERGSVDLYGPLQSTTAVPYPPVITVPVPNITCSGTGSGTTNGDTTTFTPGNYPGGISLNSTQHVIFAPGNYCFGGNVTINGSANVVANDINFSINSGSFAIAGASTFTCNNALFHINGGNAMQFNGNGGNYCNNVTFIASTGTVTWNGNVSNRFFAPTGGVYEDVLIYVPYGNTSELKLNGNSNNQFTGTIMAIQSPITISGNSGTTGLHSQIIGYTIELQGSSHTTIHYVPEEQYAQVDPSAITLTK